MKKPNGYWTYERCKEIALKCESKVDLQNKHSSVYNNIQKYQWFDLFSHMKIIGNKYKRLIYVYEFDDNYCYVGLTGNIKRRNLQHLEKDQNSSVYKHIFDTKLKPKLIIKSNYISIEESINLEEKILNQYKKNGWFILNKIKTGGLGSINLKWTKEMCEKEAKKYNKKIDYQQNSKSSYNSALKNGWLDDICSHMKQLKKSNGYWNNKELCRKESFKYKNRKEFYIKNWSAWSYSKRNGWLDEFFPILKNFQVGQQSR